MARDFYQQIQALDNWHFKKLQYKRACAARPIYYTYQCGFFDLSAPVNGIQRCVPRLVAYVNPELNVVAGTIVSRQQTHHGELMQALYKDQIEQLQTRLEQEWFLQKLQQDLA